MNKNYIFLFLICIYMMACKNDSTPLDSNLPTDFVQFYQRFHQDSIYQMDHIQFPLAGLPSYALENGLTDTIFTWSKEEWDMHKAFDDQDQTFSRQFEILTPSLIIEKIYSNKMDYGMERRFSKNSTDWMLIYYIGLNKLTTNNMHEENVEPSVEEESTESEEM